MSADPGRPAEFAVFRWNDGAARGGLGDFVGAVDTIGEARLLVAGFPHFQIVRLEDLLVAPGEKLNIVEASAADAYDAVASAAERPLWRVEALDRAGRVVETATVEHPDPTVAAGVVSIPAGGAVRVYPLPAWAEATPELGRAIVLGLPRPVTFPGGTLRPTFQWGEADPFVGELTRDGVDAELHYSRRLADLLWWAHTRTGIPTVMATVGTADIEERLPS